MLYQPTPDRWVLSCDALPSLTEVDVVALLRCAGAPAALGRTALLVDGVWSVVGSANMDIRSKELNQEGVIGILDEGFGKQPRDTFLEDLKDAREIAMEEWRRRCLLARLNERFWVAFVEQF